MKPAGLVAGVAGILISAAVACAGEATEKRELLSLHDTVARFAGMHAHTCRGLTSLCPDRCGHSGDMAVFEVVKYLRYEKPGQYGDPQGEEFRFLVPDTMRNPKVPQEIADRVATLQEGDRVRLTWRHEYVTRTESAGSSSFPERPVVRIEKLSPQAADELLENAAPGRDP